MARTDAALMPDVSEAESARGYLGSGLRLTVDFLEQRGCKAQVKQKVSAATAQLIDKPPFPFAWIPATPMDEVESALSLVAGRDACVDLGLTAARKLGGSLIQPVLKMATALFGNTPVAVFQNLERFYAMVLKGMKFDYDAVAPREAVTPGIASLTVSAVVLGIALANLPFGVLAESLSDPADRARRRRGGRLDQPRLRADREHRPPRHRPLRAGVVHSVDEHLPRGLSVPRAA